MAIDAAANSQAIEAAAYNKAYSAKTNLKEYQYSSDSNASKILYINQFDDDNNGDISAKELSKAAGLSIEEATVFRKQFMNLDNPTGKDTKAGSTFSLLEAATVVNKLYAKSPGETIQSKHEDVQQLIANAKADPASNENKALRKEVLENFGELSTTYNTDKAAFDKLFAEKPADPKATLQVHVAGHDGSSMWNLAAKAKRENAGLKEVGIPRIMKLMAEQAGMKSVHDKLEPGKTFRVNAEFVKQAADPDSKENTYWIDDRWERMGKNSVSLLRQAVAEELPEEGKGPYKVKSGDTYEDIAAGLIAKHNLDITTANLVKVLKKQVKQPAKELKLDTAIDTDALLRTIKKKEEPKTP